MLPEWAIKILVGLGFPGLFIFLETILIIGLFAYVKKLHTSADEIYGFRLAERDTAYKSQSETARVLEGVLKATEERNELTEQQAELLEKQAQAFELMKVTILHQYETIHDTGKANAIVVTAMAESIRTLSTMVTENRTIAQGHVISVIAHVDELRNDLVKAVRDAQDKMAADLRNTLGNVTRSKRPRGKSS